MIKIASVNCLDLTDKTYNIALFRAKANLPCNLCPCKIRDRMMGCCHLKGLQMKKKCYDRIQKEGVCFCGAFKKMNER